MAIAAWSAKVVASSICLSVNGSRCGAGQHDDADRYAFAQHRNAKDAPEIAQSPAFESVVGIGIHVGNVNYFSSKEGAPYRRTSIRFDRNVFDGFDELVGKSVVLRAKKHAVLLARNRSPLGVA